MLSALLFFTGLTVDFGLMLFKKRELQGATDLAALAAAQNPGRAAAIVADMLAANGFSGARVTSLTTGNYIADPSIPPGQRYVANKQAINALQLSTAFDVPMHFVSAIVPNAMLTVPATAGAVHVAEAGLVAGSGLAALGSGLPNAILGQMLGSTFSVDLVSYNGMATAQVNALDFLDALAVQTNLTAGTYGQVLSSNLGVGGVLNAEIAALYKPGALGNTQAAIAGLGMLAAQLRGSPTIALGRLFNAGLWNTARVGSIDHATALQSSVNVYQIATFAAQIANGSNFINTSLSLGLPGITSISLQLTMIEPQQGSYYALGPVGLTVHTSQIRALLDFNLLGGIALPLLPNALVNLPLYVEVADGTASLSSITCGTAPGTDTVVGVQAISGLANAYVGSVSPAVMTDFTHAVVPGRASIVNVPNVLTVTGYGQVAVQGNSQNLSFTQQQIASLTPQTISSTNMTSNLLSTLADPTLQSLQVNGLSLPLSPVAILVSTLLSPVFAVLDATTDQILSTLGVKVGYLDVTVTGARCGVPALTQ